MTIQTLDQRIEITPGVAGGKPRLAGQPEIDQSIRDSKSFVDALHARTPSKLVLHEPVGNQSQQIDESVNR